jgi:hypothetical protein
MMASRTSPLSPLSRELTQRGDRVIVRAADGRRVSSTIKLTRKEQLYVEWLRKRDTTDS